ncbi:hypothetical protein FRC96_08080 [Lujinxingia vulgaris]|uniref:JAB domain-containing protein n=1 Tax=Lujinxingia vulgaris TaxID=2600176 RepID=A0A5C6XBU9_9DELT|nr:Mov34/MPN/PAD-1 family protein [Lujinxingia vulgaris]TXD37910.1 hypothetical protein FRC96_08080 [Lujinxingia vulgaris]
MIVRQLIFEDAAQVFRVVLAQEVMESMFRLFDTNPSQETGGILIGSYSPDYTTATIVEATPPPTDSTFGRDWFHRGTDGLEEILLARWDSVPQTHYLGEWHVHTANVPWPSPQDKNQMKRMARDRRYQCAQPLLIILYPKPEGKWGVSCSIFSNGKSPADLQIVDDAEFEVTEFSDAKRSGEE